VSSLLIGKLIKYIEYLSKYASETFSAEICATTYLLNVSMV